MMIKYNCQHKVENRNYIYSSELHQKAFKMSLGYELHRWSWETSGFRTTTGHFAI